MALDAIFLAGTVAELAPKITGGRIDRIQQPDRETVILHVRRNGENHRLLINAGAGSGRLQLTALSFENPAEPPMFCMLLRKYLTGARIESVTQPPYERLVLLNISSRNEMGDAIDLRLAAELMGRSSNLVLIGTDGRIVDCLRRMDFGGDAERRMLPGMLYKLPPQQKKPLIFECDAEEFSRIFEQSDAGKPLEKRLSESFSGLSPTMCRELACRCKGDADALYAAVSALAETVKAGELTPTLLLRDAKPEGFSFMHLAQYGTELTQQSFESFCGLLDAYYAKRETLERRQKRARELTHSIKTARDRIERKLVNQREELRRTEGREEKRKTAELITANMYRIKKGDTSVAVQDYFAPDCPELVIELDPRKTPQQNAAALFKEYTKLKTAEGCLTELIAEGEKQLDYLNSVLFETQMAESYADLSDIAAELRQTGYIRVQKNAKQKKTAKSGPLRFVSSDGFEILVGRNNVQNDELTTKTARRTDLWLHTKTVHGSHVIVSCGGETPPVRTVMEAASLAAYYSNARGGGKTAVDAAMVRNVRKPAGALPGKVIYTEYTTYLAEADEKLRDRLAQNSQ